MLNPSETEEFTRDKPPEDPRGDRTSVEFDPFYVSIPFFYHWRHPTGSVSGFFVDTDPGRPTSFPRQRSTAPPPLWALGYHQCRWAEYSQDQVEALGQ